MEVIIAQSGGFCRGVKKAVDTAMSIDPHNTYVYGEIIHNPDVVWEITNRGIITVERLECVPDGATLIIRSHGVGKAVYEECARRNITVIDCTCEFVRRTQNIIKEQFAQGNAIVIVGERHHPEVVGLNGWCENTAYVFSSEKDDFSILSPKKCCVVCQTTYSKEKFDKIVKILDDTRGKTLEIFETICYTTIRRQNEARELAQKCDAILVIGGLNSSNTNKLYDICTEHCTNVFRLGSAVDLKNKIIKPSIVVLIIKAFVVAELKNKVCRASFFCGGGFFVGLKQAVKVHSASPHKRYPVFDLIRAVGALSILVLVALAKEITRWCGDKHAIVQHGG